MSKAINAIKLAGDVIVMGFSIAIAYNWWKFSKNVSAAVTCAESNDTEENEETEE